jgi:hypothetical protein
MMKPEKVPRRNFALRRGVALKTAIPENHHSRTIEFPDGRFTVSFPTKAAVARWRVTTTNNR